MHGADLAKALIAVVMPGLEFKDINKQTLFSGYELYFLHIYLYQIPDLSTVNQGPVKRGYNWNRVLVQIQRDK